MYGSSPRMYACFCIRIKLRIFLTTQTFRRSLDINDKCPLSGTYVLRSILFLKVGGMDSSKKSLQAKRKKEDNSQNFENSNPLAL